MLTYDYEYDLEKRVFISKKVDESMSFGQCFTIPEDVSCIYGFRIKLSKIGSPGDIEYRIGSEYGNMDIAQGNIYCSKVIPFYELFYGEDFNSKEVIPGKQYFIWLKVHSGLLPDDGYRIYGPHPGEAKGYKDDLMDIAHWQDSTVNVSYPEVIAQEGLPDYHEGYGIDENGEKTWSLSFRILTDKDNDYNQGEERFECVRRLTADSYTEWKNIRIKRDAPQNEVEINQSWVVSNPYTSRVIENAVEDFRNFCSRCMGFELQGNNHRIEIILDSKVQMDKEESLINISKDGIEITAADERGIMRAFYYLEDIMRYNKHTSFIQGTTSYKPIHPVRMTKGIYSDPYQYFELEEPDIYTDEYLRRISRAGYNAIWLLLNIEQLVCNSTVFPEMNDEKAPLVLKRLRELTERAENFGIDVYFEIRTWHYKPFDKKLYNKYPDLRSYEQWNNALTSPCSGSGMVMEFYHHTLAETFRRAPKIKGMLIIYDTEGFYTCFMRGQNAQCEHCKDKDSVELAVSFMEMLNDTIHADGNSRNLILWTYATQGDWSVKVLEGCSRLKDAIIMGCFSQFTKISRFGITSRVDDYAVCVSEPSEYFKILESISQKFGIPLIAKVEDAIGQEFVNTPYMFTLHQFQKKWEELLKFNCYGFMANYSHYGFYPGSCSDLMKSNCFTSLGVNTIDNKDHIENVIVQNYGKNAVDDLKQASRYFGNAMADYFPYSSGVCRYPGPIQSAPIQPFYLDKDRHVRRQRARGNVADLDWTMLKGWDFLDIKDVDGWNDQFVYKCLIRFNEEYDKGIECLKNALLFIDREYLSGIQELIDISETHSICAQTMISFIHFCYLKEKYWKKDNGFIKESIRFVLERELENSNKILDICKRNSIIGFTGSGNGNVRGGLFNPYTIMEKVNELKAEINRLIPDGINESMK